MGAPLSDGLRYVRPLPAAADGQLDQLLTSLLQAARRQNYEPDEVLQRLEHMVHPVPYSPAQRQHFGYADGLSLSANQRLVKIARSTLTRIQMYQPGNYHLADLGDGMSKIFRSGRSLLPFGRLGRRRTGDPRRQNHLLTATSG